MLPSADAAMVAFAEVTSFVRFYADTAQADAPAATTPCRSSSPSCGTGKEPDEALLAASGADLKAGTRGGAPTSRRARTSALPALFGLGGDHEAPHENDACAICETARASPSC